MAERQLEAAQSDIEVAQIELASARRGVFLGEGYNDAPYSEQRISELTVQRRLLAAQLGEQQARLAAIERRVDDERRRVAELRSATLRANVRGRVWSFLAADGERLGLRLLFDAAQVDAATARLALSDTARVLETLAEAPQTPLGAIALDAAPTGPIPAPRPAPRAAPQAEVARIAPRLAALWAELLEGETPEAEDNFFALGGHSLLTLQLQERIRAAFAVEVAVPDLFRFATLAAQSRHLAALLAEAEAPASSLAAAPDPARAEARAEGAERLRRRRAHAAARPHGVRHA